MSITPREEFRNFCQKHLNPEQLSAVIPQHGFFIVRAGAGSGKTRVITTRIMHLMLEHGVAPSAIVALTFTNKAAREMRERVIQMMPPDTATPTVSTFHAYSVQLLKRYGAAIGLAQYTILDSADRDKLLQGLIKKHPHGKKIALAQLSSTISRHKNSITSLTQLATAQWHDPVLHELFHAYEQDRKAQRSLDFDDLLLEVLRLLQSAPSCKAQLQEKVRHILIDEYQDTNKLQHAIVTELVYRPDRSVALDSLCIVGDENQSIYSWRGATVDNMSACARQFPQVATIAITQNYRSVQPVLAVANHLIQHNHGYTPHTIWSERHADDRIRLLTCYSSQQEAEIVALCSAYYQKKGTLHKLAILYRSHFQSRALEEALVRASVPYKIIGGIQFYDRQEIKDILAYLRLAVNPFDRISFMRCINTPGRSLGDVFVEQFMELWQSDAEAPYATIAELMLAEGRLPARKAQAVRDFCTIMATVTNAQDAQEAIDTIITHTKFISYLTNTYEPTEAKERIENVHELLAAVTAAMERGTITAAQFLEEIALLTDHRDEAQSALQPRDYVQLMTLHSAKGLEFDTVILPGIEEGVFPSSQACMRDEALEEERRLLYVGITRARERLIMTRTLSRYMYGTVHDQIPSRFIKELPAHHIRYTDCVRSYPNHLLHDLEGWLSGYQTARTSPTHPCVSSEHTTTGTPAAHSQEPSRHWRLQERVRHGTFGTGTVIHVEQRPAGPLITVQFPKNTKKIQAHFLTKVERA